jgi:diguanylate cyclase (GGDEF)-like protein
MTPYMDDLRRAGRTPAGARSTALAAVALVVVLVALGGLVVKSNHNVSLALADQSQALTIDGSFSVARLAVATEALRVRNYRVEPSTTNQQRLSQSVLDAQKQLNNALASASLQTSDVGRQLQAEQASLIAASNKMVRLSLNGDEDSRRVADMEVAPAYYILQRHLDEVGGAFHVHAQKRLIELRQVHQNALLAQTIGGVIASFVVIIVLRLLIISDRRVHRLARKHEQDALHDSLTGLSNRLHFTRTLSEALEDAEGRELADPRRATAVALIDMDGFKDINDTFGHQAGDAVLIAVADILRRCVHPTDLVARIGGDEFAVILRDSNGHRDPEEWAVSTAGALRCEVPIDGGEVAISGSVGVSRIEDGDSQETVSHRADQAMYHAKSAGTGAWVFDRLDKTGSLPIPSSAELLTELRQLLDSGDPTHEIALYYQARIRVSDGSICGVEALTRWRHPLRGLLQPEGFMTIAQAPPILVSFTSLVIRRVLAELPQLVQIMLESGGSVAHPSVGINIAARALAYESVVDLLQPPSGNPTARLRVEIGQLGELADVASLEPVVKRLRDIGLGVTLDNFGLGTAELDVISRWAIDELKIDRSFVIASRSERLDERVLRASAALAHSLGLSAAAQGVENQSVFDLLSQVGFDTVQGHFLARPVPLDALAVELRPLGQPSHRS